MTSGMVTTLRIGQSAGKVSKFVKLEYEAPSTTARVWVGVIDNHYESLRYSLVLLGNPGGGGRFHQTSKD